ncbi:MAG: alginate lyase [Melioribacteraceae bacterium]|nr:MAG: alginate lyase [Melioribacteraceae bacterium]
MFTGCTDKTETRFNDEENRVIKLANAYLGEKPVTVTDTTCERSAGGLHDYYSEGDYWWRDPENPDGPYIRRDGLTNPDNFTAHRKAMRRLSQIVPALVTAYKITGDQKYAEDALKHLEAWFVNPVTKMNPNLLYSQAIKGRVTGRGIGIIDTIHLVEVAQAIVVLKKAGLLNSFVGTELSLWFEEYNNWIFLHEYGISERDNGNNHSTCWAMQVAAFANVYGDGDKLEFVRKFYKTVLLPEQMAVDGSFPKELARTKPYGYSLFNMDAMAMVCEIASTKKDDLWEYTSPDGKNIQKAMEYMYPYIVDKSKWPMEPDVMYWENWPVRFNSLFFTYKHAGEKKYLELWRKLDPNPTIDEIIRNYPVRQPLLWIDL